jgi:hypothetical protein
MSRLKAKEVKIKNTNPNIEEAHGFIKVKQKSTNTVGIRAKAATDKLKGLRDTPYQPKKLRKGLI